MTITQPDLSVIIVNWNAAPLLRSCLTSVFESRKNLDVEVWVVDNASTDDSVKLLRTEFPQVKLLVNPENLGFAAANNQAASQSLARYMLLLNPDTEVPPQSLDLLVSYADSHPAVGVMGPRLLNSDGRIQRSCWRGYPDLAMAFSDALYLWKVPILPIAHKSEYQPGELTEVRDVDHLLGACMLIRREAWSAVGPLDADFLLFLEETDWCWRAKQAGWRIVYYPNAGVVHYGQHSVRQNPVRSLPQFYKSYCLFYRKHYPHNRVGLRTLKGIIALAAVVRIGLWTIRTWQASGQEQRNQSRNMRAGYSQVLRVLASL